MRELFEAIHGIEAVLMGHGEIAILPREREREAHRVALYTEIIDLWRVSNR